MKELKVKIEWQGSTFEFEGPPEIIMVEIEKFISKFIPTLSLAKKLQFSLDLRDLAEIISPAVKLSENDIIFTREASRLSQSDKILSILTARKLLYLLGKADSEYLSLHDISNSTSSSSKSSSSRLSELFAQRMVDKKRSGNKVLYCVTVNGIIRLKRKLEKLLTK